MMEYMRQIEPGDQLSMTYKKAKPESNWLARQSQGGGAPAPPMSQAPPDQDRMMLEQMMASRRPAM